MKLRLPSERVLEIYKCFIMTLLLVVFVFMAYQTTFLLRPHSVCGKIPVVRIVGGQIDVDADVSTYSTIDVEVTNTVSVEGHLYGP